jgi:hypothetical protein
VISKGAVPDMPPGSLRGLQLVVSDIKAAHAELTDRDAGSQHTPDPAYARFVAQRRDDHHPQPLSLISRG